MSSLPIYKAVRTVLPGEEVAARLAALVASDLRQAIAERGRARIVLAGGSTFSEAYQLLANLPDIDWSRVTVLFGDERCIPPTNPDSNFHLADIAFLFQVHPGHIVRMEGEVPPEEGAYRYLEMLYTLGNRELPIFDLVLLGMGPDGHTASVFRGSLKRALQTGAAVIITEPEVTGPPVTRLTMTPALLNRARHTVIAVRGEEKAGAVAELYGRRGDRLPAAHIAAALGPTDLILDQAAASQLPAQ